MQLPEIEVERKFFIENKDELEKRLIDTNGITRVACQNFTDSYYDLSNRPTITLKDNWLRYRECEQNGKIIGTWQLKKPTSRADQSFIPNKSSIYQEVEGLGDRAVFIGNMFQLQILKEGVMYNITPPNRGRTTNTGKETKAIAIEIAQHYQL